MPTIEEMAHQLQSSDEETRKHAAITLGQTDDPAAVPHLIAALDDDLRSVRRAAHECLIPFADKRAVQPLIEAAADGRLDFNAVAYSLERKFGITDAYPRTWAALENHGDESVLTAARPAYQRWQARQNTP